MTRSGRCRQTFLITGQARPYTFIRRPTVPLSKQSPQAIDRKPTRPRREREERRKQPGKQKRQKQKKRESDHITWDRKKQRAPRAITGLHVFGDVMATAQISLCFLPTRPFDLVGERKVSCVQYVCLTRILYSHWASTE